MIVVVFLNNMSAHTIYISNKKILINCDIGPGETDCIRLQPISCFRPPVNLPVHLELRLYPDVSLRNFGFNVWKYASMYRSYQAPKLREFIKIEKCVWFVFRANSILVNPKEEAGVVLICLIWCFIFDAFMQTSSNTVQMSLRVRRMWTSSANVALTASVIVVVWFTSQTRFQKRLMKRPDPPCYLASQQIPFKLFVSVF